MSTPVPFGARLARQHCHTEHRNHDELAKRVVESIGVSQRTPLFEEPTQRTTSYGVGVIPLNRVHEHFVTRCVYEVTYLPESNDAWREGWMTLLRDVNRVMMSANAYDELNPFLARHNVCIISVNIPKAKMRIEVWDTADGPDTVWD